MLKHIKLWSKLIELNVPVDAILALFEKGLYLLVNETVFEVGGIGFARQSVLSITVIW